MIDRLALGFSRAADTAEHLAVHHFWFSYAVIATLVVVCIATLVLS